VFLTPLRGKKDDLDPTTASAGVFGPRAQYRRAEVAPETVKAERTIEIKKS